MIEIPPKFAGGVPVNPEWQAKSTAQKATTVWTAAQGLAEDLAYYAMLVKTKLEAEIGHTYPSIIIDESVVKERPDLREYVGQRLPTVAWLWREQSVPRTLVLTAYSFLWQQPSASGPRAITRLGLRLMSIKQLTAFVSELDWERRPRNRRSGLRWGQRLRGELILSAFLPALRLMKSM